MSYKTIYKKGNLNGRKFMDFSRWIVKNYVTNDSRNSHLTEAALENITEVLAMDMATGSQLTKNKYITIGIVIGGGVITSVVLINKLRKERA